MRPERPGSRNPECTTAPVLVTGAFGNLGRSVVRRLVEDGSRVRAFDLPTPANRRAARRLPEGVEACFGDVTHPEDVARAVAGVQGVAHLAAVLPPLSERNSRLARGVNLDGTRALVEAAAGERADMPFVLSSSCSVYGPSQGRRGPARADSPTEATDTYTETKLAAEALLRASSLAWVVLRVGAAIEGSAAATDPIVMRMMFEVDPENPVELVHGEDVARAVARSLVLPEAYRKILPIGGGPSCRLTQRRLVDASFDAIGVAPLPDAAFGSAPYYTSWLDTDESQALLDYQRHGFDRIRADLAARFAPWRPLLRTLAPLVRLALLRLSGPYRGAPSRPTWRALIDAGY